MLTNIAHVIGLIALVFMIISFQTKKQAKLLKFQIISSLFFAIQYLLLNAMSGFFIFLFTTIRNVVFSRYKDKKVPMFLIIIYLSIVILFSYASYTNIYSDGVYKYGINNQIQKELKFFNASIYENNPYNYTSSKIKENGLYPFTNLYIKKSYI